MLHPRISQGETDRAVPKEQAERIYERAEARGGVVEYELYPGEGHGWRQEKNIKDALERNQVLRRRVGTRERITVIRTPIGQVITI